MSAPREITVWACSTCGYWRQDQSTGQHQTPNPDDPQGRPVLHDLHPLRYVLSANKEKVASDA